MVERWFPCAEVSANSDSGWGSGNTERGLFTWFAARPSAQAKAAVICALLPWPEVESEQRRLQQVVRDALSGRDAARDQLRDEIARANSKGVRLLDPFSGRGMIPLQAARLGFASAAIDYSPVAVLASELLTDYPFRDFANEPPLPYATYGVLGTGGGRLLTDVEAVLGEVDRRFKAAMSEFYPKCTSREIWGHLWAVTLPCQECNRRFPLVGSFELRQPGTRRGNRRTASISDPGQSFYLDVHQGSGTFQVVVHDGPPRRIPTLTNAIGRDGKLIRGKAAICPFCGHVHALGLHQRLAGEGQGQDSLLVVAELDPVYGKAYREPTDVEFAAISAATAALGTEAPFGPIMPAVPDEPIPLNNGATIRPQLYGAKTYGDLMVPRQTLSFVRLCRIINDLASEFEREHHLSREYSRALSGYAAAVLVRKLRYSTRGIWLRADYQKTSDLFVNEGTLSFSYDNFEPGLGDGPGTWRSLAQSSLTTLKSLIEGSHGIPTTVAQGSAADLPFKDQSFSAVVTDPPYDSMVYYTDSSDFFFVWLKRALCSVRPEMVVSPDPQRLQGKSDEIIVKEHGKAPGEHRDRAHYDSRIQKAFREMRRIVRSDGVVTIVFGHGEPEVWQRLLGALHGADLVMTGSWPANTEAGGQQGKANIQTTLTMACRPAAPNRPDGRKAAVEAEIRTEIKRRYPNWERWGLAPTDMLMAAAGPAMEVVGRYSVIRDARGEPVDISTFLPLARASVQEAMAVEIDHYPLDTFDARTRFALWWARLYGRQVVAKSELRWQALAGSIELADVRDLVPDTDKGCRLISTKDFRATIHPESAAIDVALGMAKASEEGLAAVAEILGSAGREPDDAYVWASIKFLADRLPDSDADAISWSRLLRNRSAIGAAAAAAVLAEVAAANKRNEEDAQMRLFS